MTMNERDYYNQLPELALIEIPPEILIELEYRGRAVKDYGFMLEDLIDDAMVNTRVKDSASESLEEWFDHIGDELVAQDWFHDASLEYMNAVGALFDNISVQMQQLYTPDGNHYYDFTTWFEGSTMLLTKGRFTG